jgi:hypothetical protein
MSPLEVVGVYLALGYDFVALTDHDFLLQWNCYNELFALDSHIIIFRGIELTLYERGYVHVSRIRGDEEKLHIFNHPAGYGFPVAKTCAVIEALRRTVPLDAIEVTEDGYYTPEYDIPEIDLPKVATDDAHHRFQCGRAWIEVEAERSRDAIIRAVKQGNFELGFCSDDAEEETPAPGRT